MTNNQSNQSADAVNQGGKEAVELALEAYANPDNWGLDSNGIARVWKEPDSSTPDRYCGFELAMNTLSDVKDQQAQPVSTYTVNRNWCNCHSETCCCNGWAIYDTDDKKHSTYSDRKTADQVANALNKPTIPVDQQAQPVEPHSSVLQLSELLRGLECGHHLGSMSPTFLFKLGQSIAEQAKKASAPIEQAQPVEPEEIDWEEVELNPCPRCNGNGERDAYVRFDSAEMIRIKCSKCDFKGNEHFYQGMDKAVTEWNAYKPSVDQQAHGAMPEEWRKFARSIEQTTIDADKSANCFEPTFSAYEVRQIVGIMKAQKALLDRYAAPQAPASKLEAAIAHIRAMPHGDNCFLRNDGGEFDKCFCGKDGLLNWLEDDCTTETTPSKSMVKRLAIQKILSRHPAD